MKHLLATTTDTTVSNIAIIDDGIPYVRDPIRRLRRPRPSPRTFTAIAIPEELVLAPSPATPYTFAQKGNTSF